MSVSSASRLIWIGLGILLLLSILFLPRSLWLDPLLKPGYAWLDSERYWHATLLEVTPSAQSLKNATRRLLKPFGQVTLLRIYPSDTDDAPSRRPIP